MFSFQREHANVVGGGASEGPLLHWCLPRARRCLDSSVCVCRQLCVLAHPKCLVNVRAEPESLQEVLGSSRELDTVPVPGLTVGGWACFPAPAGSVSGA